VNGTETLFSSPKQTFKYELTHPTENTELTDRMDANEFTERTLMMLATPPSEPTLTSEANEKIQKKQRALTDDIIDMGAMKRVSS
jgi:hypothetical protein